MGMTSEEIRALQSRWGLTNQQMADACCCSLRLVEKMRQGVASVSPRTLKTINKEKAMRGGIMTRSYPKKQHPVIFRSKDRYWQMSEEEKMETQGVKRLTKEEIAELQGTYQPPEESIHVFYQQDKRKD